MSMDDFCEFLMRFLRMHQGMPAYRNDAGDMTFPFDSLTITGFSARGRQWGHTVHIEATGGDEPRTIDLAVRWEE